MFKRSILVTSMAFVLASTLAGLGDTRFRKLIENESTGRGQVYSTYPLWLQAIYTHVFSWEPRVKANLEKESNEVAIAIAIAKYFIISVNVTYK